MSRITEEYGMYLDRPFPPIPYVVGLISVQADSSQHQDQRSSTYVRVDREWDKKNEAERAKAHKPGDNQTQSQTGSMLQRWLQESMLDQPYHNLKAVKK